MVTVGASALEGIARSMPICFLGVTGVHDRSGFTTGDYEEAAIKRALAARAAETIGDGVAGKTELGIGVCHRQLSLASTLIIDGLLDTRPCRRS